MRDRPKFCIRDTLPDTYEDSQYLERLRQSQCSQHEPPPRWKPKPLLRLRFTDDLTAAEKIDITFGTSSITTRKEEQLLHAPESQGYVESIRTNVGTTCMQVNEKKSQLLCITSAIN